MSESEGWDPSMSGDYLRDPKMQAKPKTVGETCPLCDGQLYYTHTGTVTCLPGGRRHLYIAKAQQRVLAGESLHDIIHSSVGR